MMRRSVVFVAVLAATASGAWAADLAGLVSLDRHWWNEHQLGDALARATGLRWAIVDGISGHGRAGGGQVPGTQVAEEFEKATGIKAEVVTAKAIGAVVLLHRPNEAKRKALEAALSTGGEAAVRAAWQLGYLKDGRAWAALARAAAGKDTAVALSAAHALRRLDGEEDFNLRRWLGGTDGGLWQVPLGACVDDALSAADLQTLAASPFVTLREAAARIAPGCADGRVVAEKLAADPSLVVRQAAARALRAWQPLPADAKPTSQPVQKPDLAKHWQQFSTKTENGARASATTLALYGSDDDLKRIVEIYPTITDENARVPTLNALAYNAGGSIVADLLRKLAAGGAPWPDDNHGWGRGSAISMGKYGLAMLFDGEALAKELGPRLGTENWALSSEFLLARFSGPPALPHLEKVLTKRGHVAPLAVGAIGGPDAVKMIAPLLASEDLSTATAAARGLGESGQLAAVPPLVKALASPNRVVRSRAALALGRIGGPEAAAALAECLKAEKEYLPRRSACAMLREINAGEPAHAALAAEVEKELAAFVPAYSPVNPKFGPDFPVGQWVPVGGVLTVASIGETRCAVDPYSGIWVRYGGCSGCYSNECIGYDAASGKWFVVRPPEMMGLFYNETRAAQGCSRGMAFDAKGRRFWINHAVGGNGLPANGAMYPGRRTCNYDLPLDRFQGRFADSHILSGEGPTWFVADSTRGCVFTERMGPTTAVIETATGKLIDHKFAGAPDLSGIYNHDPAAYDPVSGLLLRTVNAGNAKYTGDKLGLWLFDPAKGTAVKSKAGHPEGAHGGGNAMVYDSLNREVLLFLSSGAWRYDREKDAWEKAADGNAGVYVVDYDPQHNVFLALRPPGGFIAFRYKNVPVGTKAKVE